MNSSNTFAGLVLIVAVAAMATNGWADSHCTKSSRAECTASTDADCARSASANCTKTTGATSTDSADASPDLVATASSAGKFKTLLRAAGAAGLVETLRSPGPFTVFAPTDEAFAALPDGVIDQLLEPANRERLRAVLLYHVVAGRLTSNDVVRKQALASVQGESIPIEVSWPKVSIAGASIEAADVAAANGVIHVIGKVLLPPTVAATMTEPTGPAAIGRVVDLAIRRGVPLYNDGQAGACADVYEVTITGLLTLASSQFSAEQAADLREALARAAAADSASDRAWTLRRALDRVRAGSAQASVADAPLILREASLPGGFPEPGPIGRVSVKRYPSHRAAVATGGQRGAFMKLLRHIKRQGIAMTAPVEQVRSDDGSATESMAFFYGDATLGRTGNDGDVQVKQRPAQTVASIGMRGRQRAETVAEAIDQLNAWIEAEQKYRIAGPPRTMGYNSPMVPDTFKFWEVQIPIQPTDATASTG